MENKEKLNKRAEAIADMGLVERIGQTFKVGTPMLRGRQTFNTVSRKDGKIVCDCLEFEAESPNDSGFRCEHILAVGYFLLKKSSQSV